MVIFHSYVKLPEGIKDLSPWDRMGLMVAERRREFELIRPEVHRGGFSTFLNSTIVKADVVAVW